MTTQSQSFFPPTPDVQHLPTLFRRIQNGEIRIPAFQRGFVWKEAQVVELLESVYRGFPIGSLLFWNVKERLLRIERSLVSPFPDVKENYPFEVLIGRFAKVGDIIWSIPLPRPGTPGLYNVVFDLDTEEFRHFEAGLSLSRTIPLSSLFSPKHFLEAQRSFDFLSVFCIADCSQRSGSTSVSGIYDSDRDD